MAIGTIRLTLDTFAYNHIPEIVVVKNDYSSRFIEATITAKGTVIPVAATASVAINAERPDGESGSYEGKSNGDGTVCVPLPQWMSKVVGRVKCNISVVDDDKKISTTYFYVQVQETPNDTTEISPDNPDMDIIASTLSLLNEVKAGELKDAYGYAKEGGYEGSKDQFAQDINPDNILEKATPQKGIHYHDGSSVTVSKVTTSTADNGKNIVKFSDGTTLTVENGSQGKPGTPGTQGKKGEKGESGQPRVITEISPSNSVSINLKNDSEYRFPTPLSKLTIEEFERVNKVALGYIDIEYIGFFADKTSADAFDFNDYNNKTDNIYTAAELFAFCNSGTITGKRMDFELHSENGRNYLRAKPTWGSTNAILWSFSKSMSASSAKVCVIGCKTNIIGKGSFIALPQDNTFNTEYFRVSQNWTERDEGVSYTKHTFDMSDNLSACGIEVYEYLKFNPWSGQSILVDVGYSEQWSVFFTAADDGVTVALPTTVDVMWAVAEPEFTPGYSYMISFVPCGDKIIGIWTEVR